MGRVKFQKGEQTDFLKDVKDNLNASTWQELAKSLKVNRRTLIDWKNEKYTLPEEIFEKCLELADSNLKVPEVKRKDRYWYTSKAAIKGGNATYEKYGRVGGDPKYRKKKWREWWEKEGKFKTNLPNPRKEINEPIESKTLAEFIGIVLGDGGITHEQVTISLDKNKHRDYARLIQKLVEDLFQIEAPIYDDFSKENSLAVTISSKNLVEFLLKKGLKKGNKVKQQVGVPTWIKDNIGFSKSCLRGLIDTDGGVYFHRHKSHGQKLFNIGLTFTNRSKPLLDFVEERLNRFNFTPKRNYRGDNIFLYRQQEVFDYNREIEFHNSYHSKRVKEFQRKKANFKN